MWVFSRSTSTCYLNLHTLLECFTHFLISATTEMLKIEEMVPDTHKLEAKILYILEPPWLYLKFKCIKLNTCNLFLYPPQHCLSWPHPLLLLLFITSVEVLPSTQLHKPRTWKPCLPPPPPFKSIQYLGAVNSTSIFWISLLLSTNMGKSSESQ